jgi:hypothetical protein
MCSVKKAFGSKGKELLINSISKRARDEFKDYPLVYKMIEENFQTSKKTECVIHLHDSLEKDQKKENDEIGKQSPIEKESQIEHVFRPMSSSLKIRFALSKDKKSQIEVLSLTTKPFAGINSKYLDENPVNAPDKDGSLIVIGESPSQGSIYPLVSIEEKAKEQNIPKKMPIPVSINLACFKADFYSKKDIPNKEDKITFVCAGRKEKALIPQPEQGRSIIVCTQKEYQEALKDYRIFDKADFLVLKH